MKFTTEGLDRRFVLAYRLKKPSTLKRRGLDWAGTTVYEQHHRYSRAYCYFNKDPIFNFDKDLLGQLSLWIFQGEEVVLMMDANTNIYCSPFACKLADIGLKGVYKKVNDEEAPPSHEQGTKNTICAVFAPQGIDCKGSQQK